MMRRQTLKTNRDRKLKISIVEDDIVLLVFTSPLKLGPEMLIASC